MWALDTCSYWSIRRESVCVINTAMVTPTAWIRLHTSKVCESWMLLVCSAVKYNSEELHTLGTAVASYSTRHLNQVCMGVSRVQA